MKHILAELAATKSLCQVLLDRQAAFEQAVGQQLNRMMVCLDELLVLTPGPIMPSPVDVLASPQITDSTPTTKSVMSSSPSHASSQGFVLATSCSGSHPPTHTANKEVIVLPSSTPIHSCLKIELWKPGSSCLIRAGYQQSEIEQLLKRELCCKPDKGALHR